jgi:2-polyprenyl-3-methyl-5-hydroxy-6-metoxy-1,4-benzoquinol methylase
MPLRVDLHRRRLQPELMDQPGLDPDCHDQALHGLARINAVSRSAAILWPRLRSLARRLHPRPLRILDVASGAGDVPVQLEQMGRRTGLRLEIAGCDRSTEAVRHAARRAEEQQANVAFFPCDALAGDLPPGWDAVISSLFLHHLEADQAVLLLQRMARAAARLVLVNDLIRSLPGYLLACLGTRLLSRSPLVHVDGPRSVEGAFILAEVRDLARRAGLQGARLSEHWPYRFLLAWRRS